MITNHTAIVPEPEVRSLAQDQVEWIVPPAIMAVSEGKWTYWKEDDLDKDTSCFCPVFSRPDDCKRVCYDRVERRELYFIENFEVPPGAISKVDLFSFPAPDARFVELSDGMVTKEFQASHWLYTECVPKRGTGGQRAPTPPLSELPLRSSLQNHGSKLSAQTLKSSQSHPIISPVPSSSVKDSNLLPQRPIPTEPRAHHQRTAQTAPKTGESQGESSLGHCPRAPTLENKDPSSEWDRMHPKRLRGAEHRTDQGPEVITTVSALPTPSVPSLLELEESSLQLPTSSEKQSEKRLKIDAMAVSSSDSCFLCFEGLPLDWETCCSWFYGKAVSSHFVWIEQMYRTESNSQSLIWLDIKSNEDACKLRGFLTHRTTKDDSLVISHFISEDTFMKAIQSYTDKWERPAAPLPLSSDDPMEGPSQPAPLETWLTSPRWSPPAPDVTLLHRAGVTLEEWVEGTKAPWHNRGGKKHRKWMAKHQSHS